MMLKKSFLPLCLILPLTLWARGGSVIGNGAGLAENNFQYAYQSLPRFIENCLGSDICKITKQEKSILEKIQKALLMNLPLNNRLVFVSEKSNPDFFTTGLSESNRIAKTELSTKTPIYINVDLLYKDNGSINIDIPTMYSILVHELGHQVGIKAHDILDILGSKIKKFVSDSWQEVHLPLDKDMGGPALALIANHSQPFKSTDVILQWRNKSLEIGPRIAMDAGCTEAEGDFSGIQLFNAHFDLNQENLNLQFLAWADVYCYRPADKTVRVYRKSFGYEVGPEMKLLYLGSTKFSR